MDSGKIQMVINEIDVNGCDIINMLNLHNIVLDKGCEIINSFLALRVSLSDTKEKFDDEFNIIKEFTARPILDESYKYENVIG
jgi:hypothetical protein